MKVLFAVSNESISEAIIKKYQQTYKEIISSKNVYYFNAIIKELQKDKSYDRIVISEDLEPFANNNYETIDNFLFEKLDSISDEASNNQGEDIPIILIAADRRAKGENILVKLFGIGIYSALIGDDRSIDKVCSLIYKPRSKKEAKLYYKIAATEVEYKAESEGDVSEVEIQNILAHYKRLGKNEDKYVESFDSIANQYNDQQLKLIIKFLPLNVKAVLEANSPKYQQLMAFSPSSSKTATSEVTVRRRGRGIVTQQPQAEQTNGIQIKSIVTGEKQTRLTKPVVIPGTVQEKPVQKIVPTAQENTQSNGQEQQETILNQQESMQPSVGIVDEVVPKKRGRGRPRKEVPVEENVETAQPVGDVIPKRRGRPRKIPVEPVNSEVENVLPGFENIPEQNEPTLPGFEDSYEQNTATLPGFESNENDGLPNFEQNPIQNTNNIIPGIEEQQESYVPNNIAQNNQYTSTNNMYNVNYQRPQDNVQNLTNYNQEPSGQLQNLLYSGNKKIVGFVGTSKNGTSFLVNNLAQILSAQGIKTAILDLTNNKNAYYIYTKNEEQLRKVAFNSIDKLSQGVAQGIVVNKNLDVYTSLPGDEQEELNAEAVLSTLANNYDVVLADCDFRTPYHFMASMQEIYLVQSMDVLTIQPLTAYLRDLKAKNILDNQKLRIVINKYTKVRSITEKTIIGGMAFYNDPSMSFMTELFNRETIRYVVIPFEVSAYAKYLEGLVNCSITLNGYSKDMINHLEKLANMVYPLISEKQKYGKNTKNKFNSYNSSYNNGFSNSMNNTLDKMKNNF